MRKRPSDLRVIDADDPQVVYRIGDQRTDRAEVVAALSRLLVSIDLAEKADRKEVVQCQPR